MCSFDLVTSVFECFVDFVRFLYRIYHHDKYLFSHRVKTFENCFVKRVRIKFAAGLVIKVVRPSEIFELEFSIDRMTKKETEFVLQAAFNKCFIDEIRGSRRISLWFRIEDFIEIFSCAFEVFFAKFEELAEVFGLGTQNWWLTIAASGQNMKEAFCVFLGPFNCRLDALFRLFNTIFEQVDPLFHYGFPSLTGRDPFRDGCVEVVLLVVGIKCTGAACADGVSGGVYWLHCFA